MEKTLFRVRISNKKDNFESSNCATFGLTGVRKIFKYFSPLFGENSCGVFCVVFCFVFLRKVL